MGPPLRRELPAAADAAADSDIVVGDGSDLEVLKRAGAERASAVLAMLDDDSENAFVVLAVKELHGSAQTIAAVNDARHLARIKLVQPDVVIAPQVLGGELTAMLLAGETVTSDFVMQRVFQRARLALRNDRFGNMGLVQFKFGVSNFGAIRHRLRRPRFSQPIPAP